MLSHADGWPLARWVVFWVFIVFSESWRDQWSDVRLPLAASSFA
jgi:hypothetical protein